MRSALASSSFRRHHSIVPTRGFERGQDKRHKHNLLSRSCSVPCLPLTFVLDNTVTGVKTVFRHRPNNRRYHRPAKQTDISILPHEPLGALTPVSVLACFFPFLTLLVHVFYGVCRQHAAAVSHTTEGEQTCAHFRTGTNQVREAEEDVAESPHWQPQEGPQHLPPRETHRLRRRERGGG